MKIFFSFLYIAGDKKSTIWTIKKGIEIIKEANNDIFRLDMKTSGNPVKIILLLSESTNNLNKGLEKYINWYKNLIEKFNLGESSSLPQINE